MEEKIILPQNTRLMGALLGFIGGGLDVFCHMHYRSLVATQTGNLLLLIADWHDPRVENTIMRFSSILFSRLALWLPSISKSIARQPFGGPRC